MGFFRFVAASSQYAASAAAPNVTATPCSFFVLARTTASGTGQVAGGVFRRTTQDDAWRISLTAAGFWSFQVVGAGTAGNANSFSAPIDNSWELTWGIAHAATSRECYHQNISDRADSAFNRTPVITHLAIGANYFATPSQFFNGDIAYFGALDDIPSIEEMKALFDWKNNHPLDVVPHRLRHYYEAMPGTTIRDLIGGLDLTTVNSPTYVDGDAIIPKPKRFRSRTLPLFGRRAKFRASQGDTWVEAVSKSWEAGKHPPVEVHMDQAGNEIGIRVDSGTPVLIVAPGTFNAPAATRVLGAPIVDGSVVSDADEGWLGYAAFRADVPTGGDLTSMRARARTWTQLTEGDTGSLSIPFTGGTLDLSGTIRDPTGMGWHVEDLSISQADATIGADGQSAVITNVLGSIGDTIDISFTAVSDISAGYRTTLKLRALEVRVVGSANGLFANGYKARQQLAIFNRTGTTLLNYQVLLDTNAWPALSAMLKSLANGGYVTDAGGDDIVLALEDGTVLQHELIYWNATTGRTVLNFRLPSVPHDVQIRPWIYAGNPSVSSPTANPAALWAEHWGVIDCRTGTDRTGRGHDMTPTGVGETSFKSFPRAGSFDGVTAELRDTSVTEWGGNTGITVAVFGEPTFSGENRTVVRKGPTAASSRADAQSFAFYFRNATAAGVQNVLGASVMRAGHANASYALSEANHHLQQPCFWHITQEANEAPKIYENGVLVPNSSEAAVSGAVVDVVGDLVFGVDMNQSGWPAAGKIKGKFAFWYKRDSVVSAAWAALEAKNYLTPELVLGVGNLDLPSDIVRSPIGGPIELTVTTAIPTTIDVTSVVYNPGGRTLTVTDPGSVTYGSVTVDPNDASKIIYTASRATTQQWTVTVSNGVKTCLVTIRAISIGDAPSVPLSDSRLLVSTPQPSTGTSVKSDAMITPREDALLEITHRSRDSATHIHGTPLLEGFRSVSTPVLIDTYIQAGVTSGFVRVSVWRAQVNGNPGTGPFYVTGRCRNVADTADESVFQQHIEVEDVVGHDQSAPIRQHASAGNNTGTTLALTLPAAPLASSMVHVAIAENASNSGVTPNAGFQELVDEMVSSGSIHAYSMFDRTDPPTSVTVAGLNNQHKAGVIYEIAAAAAVAVDSSPTDNFNFTNLTGQATSTVVTSNQVTITGINVAVNVAVSGPGAECAVSTGGVMGAFSATAKTVTNGEKVQLRHTTSGSPSTTITTQVTIGDLVKNWSSTTAGAGDTTPDAFSFTDLTNQDTAAQVFSEEITITGISVPVSVSSTNSSFSVNGDAYSTTTRNISNGQTLQLRMTSSANYSTKKTTTVTVGSADPVDWSVTTKPNPGGSVDTYELDLTGAKLDADTWADFKSKLGTNGVGAAGNPSVLRLTGSGTYTSTITALSGGGFSGGEDLNISRGGTAGNPITLMCQNVGSWTTTNVTWKISAPYVNVWGFKITGRASGSGIFAILNHHIELHRIEITAWGSLSHTANESTGLRIGRGPTCHDILVNRCEIHHPLDWTTAERNYANGQLAQKPPDFGVLRQGVRTGGSNNSNLAYNIKFRYYYGHHSILRPTPGLYGSGQTDLAEFGESNPITVADSGIELYMCLFTDFIEPKGSGVVDFKASGCRLERVCCDRMYGNLGLRSDGGRQTLVSCYLGADMGGALADGVTHGIGGIGAYGENNLFLGLVCQYVSATRHSRLSLLQGHVVPDLPGRSQYVAKNNKIIGGNGRIAIGWDNGVKPKDVAVDPMIPVTGTRIEAHGSVASVGATDSASAVAYSHITTQQSSYGWQDAVNATYRESGATKVDTASQPFVCGTRILPAEVGPLSGTPNI